MTQPTDQASTADLSRYAIHYEPLFQTLETIDVQQLIDTVTEPWYNQTLIQVGDVLISPWGDARGVPLAQAR